MQRKIFLSKIPKTSSSRKANAQASDYKDNYQSATEIEEILILSERMNSDSDAEIDIETPIETVTFSNSLHCLKTEKKPYAAECKYFLRSTVGDRLTNRLVNEQIG
ncbi:hypothetical protein TNCV_2974201 [Trichonephila clavipes]|nr:hypothetical protein TNCV_2974201 [Trichonephila clavipes]